MSNKKEKYKDREYVPDNGEFAIEIKNDKRDAFRNKKETQEAAHKRRQRIRELQEDNDWN